MATFTRNDFHTKKSQRGMTFIGMAIVLTFLGFVVLITLRIIPEYMEYSKVASVLNGVADDSSIKPSKKELRKIIDLRLYTNAVDDVSSKDFEFVKKGPDMDIIAKYEKRIHIVGNVDVVITFDKTVTVEK